MIFIVNHTVTIERLLDTSGEKDYDTVVVSGLGLYIEPLDDTIGVTIDGEGAFDVQKVFTDFQDIQVSDKITDENGEIYIVKGVKKYISLVGEHLEIIVQSEYD